MLCVRDTLRVKLCVQPLFYTVLKYAGNYFQGSQDQL